MKDASRKVAQHAIDNSPHDTTRCIIEQKGTPMHIVHSCQKSSPETQQSDKAAQEDGLSTVTSKETLCIDQMLWLDKEVAPKALYEGTTPNTPDGITKVIA